MPVSKWLKAVSKRIIERSIEHEFEVLTSITDGETHYGLCMSDQKFLRKNRYSDILTYKHSRIDLQPRESCNDSIFDLKTLDTEYDSYINANFIDVSYAFTV
jgi:protein tyrosine phosphatase